MTADERNKLKYPDTNYFTYYNANPKGKLTTDCVIRSLTVALEQDYKDTLMELVAMELDTGLHIDDKALYINYLKTKGWEKHKQPRKIDNTKYTGEEFCALIQSQIKSGDYSMNRIFANIGGHHCVAIINGKVNDIWNSTEGCIGNYWVKEG